MADGVTHTEELVTLEGRKYLLLDGYLLVSVDKLRERLAQDFGGWLREQRKARRVSVSIGPLKVGPLFRFPTCPKCRKPLMPYKADGERVHCVESDCDFDAPMCTKCRAGWMAQTEHDGMTCVSCGA